MEGIFASQAAAARASPRTTDSSSALTVWPRAVENGFCYFGASIETPLRSPRRSRAEYADRCRRRPGRPACPRGCPPRRGGRPEARSARRSGPPLRRNAGVSDANSNARHAPWEKPIRMIFSKETKPPSPRPPGGHRSEAEIGRAHSREGRPKKRCGYHAFPQPAAQGAPPPAPRGDRLPSDKISSAGPRRASSGLHCAPGHRSRGPQASLGSLMPG